MALGTLSPSPGNRPGIWRRGATKQLHDKARTGMLRPMQKKRDRKGSKTRRESASEESELGLRKPRKPSSAAGRRAARQRAIDSDLPERDSEDEIDLEDEADARRARVRSKARRRPDQSGSTRRRGPARAKRQRLPSEEQLDSPKRQTLYLLGAVAAATVLMWGAARFACNAHPPASKKPRHVTTGELASTPKGAAIELQQRWIGHEYSAAMELAKGEAAEQILRDLHACETDISACDKKREQAAGKLKSIAELVSSTRRRAKVRVRTSLDGQAPQTYLLELELGPYWWQTVKRTAE